MTAAKLAIGDIAPDFSLLDQSGAPVALDDFTGSKVVLYFYPEAGTPGCTKQACDFRDNLGSLKSAGYQVLGVSKDPVDKLARFAADEGLTFPVLSDQDLVVHAAYGAWGEKNLYGKTVVGTIRSTFVIGEDGRVELPLYNVKATGHVASLRKKLGIDA
jgi:peroxiredoxin Q/BCP